MADGLPDKKWIKEQLIFNGDKNFVQRLFKKDAPQMDIGNGRVATHQMSWGQTGPDRDPKTKYRVYPNIVWDKKQKGLKWLDGREAQQYANKTGEFIEVNSPDEAEMLSTHYKEVVPDFMNRGEGKGGPGSSSYQMVPTEEEKERIKQNKIKLGLMNKPKEKKNGR